MTSRTSSLAALAKLEQRKDARKPVLKKADSLTNFKDKTAFNLLQREEQNAKKSRLESLLQQQFVAKYGSKQTNSSINNFIKSTVTDFVYSYASVSVAETMIKSLESQIREISANMRVKLQTARQEKQESLLSQQNGNGQRGAGNNGSSSSSSGGGNGGGYGNDGQGRGQRGVDPSWALVNAVLAQEAEEKERQKVLSAEQAKAKFRTELDKQRANVAQRHTQVEAEKTQAFEMVRKAREEYEVDQVRVKEHKEKIFVLEREMRLKQIEDNKAVREKERQIKIMQEQMDMARSRRMQEEEQELVRIKKEEQKRAQDRLVEENEHNKAIKAVMVQKQWEEEKRLHKEYEAKMLREELARQEAFQARIDALKKSEKGFAHIAGQRAQAEADNAQRTMDEVEKKYKADADKLLAKEQQRRQDIERSREFNMTLIERKQRLREEERDKDVAMRRKIEQDAQQAADLERRKAEDKRKRMNELKSKLDEQVQYHHSNTQSGKASSGLSTLEAALNKKIIAKIENDPALFAKVMERVAPSPAKPSGGFKWG